LQIQKIVALSIIEAEYVAVIETTKEWIWLQGLIVNRVGIHPREKCFS